MTAELSHGCAVVAVVTRFPEPGAAKTRLEPLLGSQGAAELHRELAAHCVARMRPLQATGEAQVQVHWDGGSAAAVREWLGDWPHFIRQADGDLGERLRAVLGAAIGTRARSAVVLGSDCPCARATHVRSALEKLDTHDIVIGPADDGGYWLLGVSARAASRALAVLFDGVAWGSATVLRETLARAEAASLQVAMVDELSDVDRPEDLRRWHDERARERQKPGSVSVVVPALNEVAHIGGAVHNAFDGGADEVIVVDGGSTDATSRAAAGAGARVIAAPTGRALQMNAGAAAALGDALVFLHADTRLPVGFASRVRDALAVGGTSGGAFTFAADGDSLAGLLSWIGRARNAIFKVPYGDQALFLRRRTFEDLGGYPVQPVMEDWELARRLARLGEVRLLPECAVSSSRRWTEAGLLVPTIAYLAIIAGYRLGVDPVVLDGWRRP